MDGHRRGGTRCALQVRTAARDSVGLHSAGGRVPIRVLILEDDPDTEFALALVLSLDDGFEADIVHDVATCLERLRASTAMPDGGWSHPYDVLLLDVVLAGGHWGTEVLEAATAMGNPQLTLPPVIVCTALSGTYLAARAPWLAANHIRVLLKPFELEVLTAELRTAATGDARPDAGDGDQVGDSRRPPSRSYRKVRVP
jgi:DNA-binding response OmpR family regulator